MRSLGWLHFSDLHQGMESQGWLWPGVRDILFTDLEQLHERCGPWDLVLFSGDLTQRGSVDEFNKFEATLTQLLEHLRRLGSNPSLFAVPGNHDLVRPDPRRPETLVLARWDTYPEVRDEFWRDAASPYRLLVEQAFAPYTAWHDGHPYCAVPRTAGLLPGDFSAVLTKDGLRLGVVGLNSAFLQVSGGNFEGKLAVDVRQFHAACGGDGPAWVRGCDFALLMTHHPPDWLAPTGRDQLFGEIATPGRFNAHLFGHMHEQMVTTLAVGGAVPRRQIQGSSLFGLEAFGDGKVDRRHGYAAGKITVDDRGEAGLRIWPRIARRHPAGHWRVRMDVDAFELEDDQGTRPEPLPPVRVAAAAPSSVAGPPSVAAPPSVAVLAAVLGQSERPNASLVKLQPAGAPYDADWHVPRDTEERAAMIMLAHPAQPVLLVAPNKSGKTWFVRHLLQRVREQDGDTVTILLLDMKDVGAGHASYQEFILAFAAHVEAEAGVAGGMRADQFLPINVVLTRFVRAIHDAAPARLIVAIDSLEALWKLDDRWRDDFVSLLRSWPEKSQFVKLRLILAMSTTPHDLGRAITSPFNQPPIRLDDLSPEQCSALARKYELGWGPPELDALMSLVGGHPYLVRHAMHTAAVRGLSIHEILAPQSPCFEEFIRRYSERLSQWPELRAAVRALMSSEEMDIDSPIAMRLEEEGLTSKDPLTERSRLRYRIFKRLRL